MPTVHGEKGEAVAEERSSRTSRYRVTYIARRPPLPRAQTRALTASDTDLRSVGEIRYPYGPSPSPLRAQVLPQYNQPVAPPCGRARRVCISEIVTQKLEKRVHGKARTKNQVQINFSRVSHLSVRKKRPTISSREERPRRKIASVGHAKIPSKSAGVRRKSSQHGSEQLEAR